MAGDNRHADSNPSLPDSTPPKSGPDWTMTAFMDLKVAIASMDGNIKALTEKVSDLKDEQATIKAKLSDVEKKIYAATLIITVVIAIGGFFANKAIDFGLDMAKRSAFVQQAPSVSPTVPPLPSTPAQRQ
jgi:hypothetical protein